MSNRNPQFFLSMLQHFSHKPCTISRLPFLHFLSWVPTSSAVFCPQITTIKNQYFLSPDHDKSIFSLPGSLKINTFCPRTTKNQYFLSLDNQKSIFLISVALKINIVRPQNTKKSIFSVPGTKINIFCPRPPQVNMFCPGTTKN